MRPHFREQIIRDFGIDPKDIPKWEKLSTGQLHDLLSCHPSLHELYKANKRTERNRRLDVLDDLQTIWAYEEVDGAPTFDELERLGKVAWESLAEILPELDDGDRDFLAKLAQSAGYTLDIPTGAERWTPHNIRRVNSLLDVASVNGWERFSKNWDAIGFDLYLELTKLVHRLNMQEVLAKGWRALPPNTMAETPVGALRRRICSELPPPGFFANEKEAQIFDTLQKAFRVLLDDAYAEEVLEAIGVWDPSGAWYIESNVKELNAYSWRIFDYLSQDKPKSHTATSVMGGLRPGVLHRTKLRTVKLIQAKWYYYEEYLA